MEYPKDFPEHLKHPVEAAIAQAEITFSSQSSNFAGYWSPEEGEQWMYEYVHSVFTVFASQACRVFRDGTWSGEGARNALNLFLDSIIEHVFDEKHPTPTDHLRWKFRRNVIRSIQNSEEWTKIQTEVKRIAEAQETSGPLTQSRALLERTKKLLAEVSR